MSKLSKRRGLLKTGHGAWRHALYGPQNRYPPPPEGGMCISVFAVVVRGGKILLGIPAKHKHWTSEWVPGWLMYSKDELAEAFQQWRLPSSYLVAGEHPDGALRRVMLDQLQIGNFTLTAPKILSYYSASDWYPGKHHWDLVFVYSVRTDQRLGKPPWWRELAFVDRSRLAGKEFGWNADLMKDLKLFDERS